MGSIDDRGHDASYNIADDSVALTTFEIESSAETTASSYETLLLSWLLVLLRTHEDGRASFQWTYRNRHEVEQPTSKIRLSTDDVLTESQLQSSFAQTAEAVSRHVKANASGLQAAKPDEISVIVSTGSLSDDEDAGDYDVSTTPHTPHPNID